MQSGREFATEILRERILSGTIAAGARLNEVMLSDEIAVSRTPLREGLLSLSAEGMVESRPRRGFFVKPFTLEEFDGLYALRPLLDPEALRLSGRPDAADLQTLRDLNEKFVTAASAFEAVMADEAFHYALISNCPNKVLLDLIGQIMLRTRRYELALFRETDAVYSASGEHAAILDALEAGEMKRAIELLADNMRSGAEPIRAWLSKRKD